jgi:hypothetical protein
MKLPTRSKSESWITIRIIIALSPHIDHEAWSNLYQWHGSVDVNFLAFFGRLAKSPRQNSFIYIHTYVHTYIHTHMHSIDD